ncbi:MAG: hypothetical protein LIP00_02615 [Parabacteroides sp.]|nr:hypothetical protein [Parabacteroides sp.]
MEIIRLEGTDSKLYELIAPLAMNPAILRQNNNYPFKTSVRYKWYIAISDRRVVGFMPLRKNGARLLIDNYYINGDNSAIIDLLLDAVTSDLQPDSSLEALVHNRHTDDFRCNRFLTDKELTNYAKMHYNQQKEITNDLPTECI